MQARKQFGCREKKGKEKQSREEKDTSPQHVRRSSRLKGKLRTMQTKGPHFIYLGGETPEQPPATSLGRSPHHTSIPQPNFDMSPSRPDLEISPSQQDFWVGPRKTTP